MPEQPIIEQKSPTCYRHSERETRMSCGRCGKPLCPDCTKHGPVGIRCDECLNPRRAQRQRVEPKRVRLAITLASLAGVLWIPIIGFASQISGNVTPNAAAAVFAGFCVGLIIWLITGRTSNRATERAAVVIGAALPLIATVAVIILLLASGQALPPLSWVDPVRLVVAAALGALVAWMMVTHESGGSKLLD